MGKEHTFSISTRWLGNRGRGTAHYAAYGREHEIGLGGKVATIPGSSAVEFRGDPSRYNPEELLIAALSVCHMLWFLHLCADGGVVVMAYGDAAEGTMRVNAGGSGEFIEVILRPAVEADGLMNTDLLPYRERAHELCFIARSVKFPVRCEPR